MAEPAAAVVDTHALLFHAAGHRRLGPRARAHLHAAERGQALVYVPAPVIWEIGLLARVVRITLHRPLRVFCEELFSNPAFQPVDLTPAQIYLADEFRFTRDPFDGLICAVARDLDLPLLTRDAAIQEAGVVKVVW